MEDAIKLVQFVVRTIEAAGAPGGLRQDLVSEGLLGLAEAVPLYDAEKGASLGTYAFRRIQGRILNAMSHRSRERKALPPWFTAATAQGKEDRSDPVSAVMSRPQTVRPAPGGSPEACPARTIESRITAGKAALLVARLLRRLPDAPRRLVVECAMKRRPVAEVSRELKVERRKATRLLAGALTEMRRRLDQQGYSLSAFV